MNESIDIVIPWVNGNDPEWIRLRNKYRDSDYPKEATASCRFRDWNNLKYWFRAVEKFMPWVNKVFFITFGHRPAFLNEKCNKLKIVNHTDYIPSEYLPTFNSTTIIMNVHRIEELSECFILFNDDVFPIRGIDRELYFLNGMVRDQAIQSVVVPHRNSVSPWQCRYLNNLRIINTHFNKRTVVNNNREKWFSDLYSKEDIERNQNLEYWDNFTGFRSPHLANPYQKSVLNKIWELEYEHLDTTSKNRFRNYTDVSDYVIRYWQLCEGDFVPRRGYGTNINLSIDNYMDAVDIITNQKDIMVSIMDENLSDSEFEIVSCAINNAFEEILPEKCSFEKDN